MRILLLGGRLPGWGRRLLPPGAAAEFSPIQCRFERPAQGWQAGATQGGFAGVQPARGFINLWAFLITSISAGFPMMAVIVVGFCKR